MMEKISDKNIKVGDEVIILEDDVKNIKGVVLMLLHNPEIYGDIDSAYIYTSVGSVFCIDSMDKIVITGHNYNYIIAELRNSMGGDSISVFVPEEE